MARLDRAISQLTHMRRQVARSSRTMTIFHSLHRVFCPMLARMGLDRAIGQRTHERQRMARSNLGEWDHDAPCWRVCGLTGPPVEPRV
jgi:hypothetical protein